MTDDDHLNPGPAPPDRVPWPDVSPYSYTLVMLDGTTRGPQKDLLGLFALAKSLNERSDNPPVTKQIVRSDGVVLANYGFPTTAYRALLKVFENDQERIEDEEVDLE